MLKHLVILAFYASRLLPALGQCNSQDLNFWRTGGGFFNFEENIEECYQIQTKSPVDTERCIVNRISEFSTGCVDCTLTYAQCIDSSCRNLCGVCTIAIVCGEEAGDQCNPLCTNRQNAELFFENDCTQCRIDNCNTQFEICAGFQVNACNGCIDPDPETELSMVVLIAGGVAGLLGVMLIGFLVWKRVGKSKALDLEDGATEVKSEIGLMMDPLARMSKLPSQLPSHIAYAQSGKLRRPESYVPSVLPGEDIDGPVFVAIADFEPEHQDELSFLEDELLFGLEPVNEDWYYCRNKHGHVGIAPLGFLEQRQEIEEAQMSKRQSTKSDHSVQF